MSFTLSQLDDSLKEQFIKKILDANTSGEEWIESEKSSALSKHFQRSGATATISYNNQVSISLNEYSAYIKSLKLSKAKDQAERLIK